MGGYNYPVLPSSAPPTADEIAQARGAAFDQTDFDFASPEEKRRMALALQEQNRQKQARGATLPALAVDALRRRYIEEPGTALGNAVSAAGHGLFNAGRRVGDFVQSAASKGAGLLTDPYGDLSPAPAEIEQAKARQMAPPAAPPARPAVIPQDMAPNAGDTGAHPAAVAPPPAAASAPAAAAAPPRITITSRTDRGEENEALVNIPSGAMTPGVHDQPAGLPPAPAPSPVITGRGWGFSGAAIDLENDTKAINALNAKWDAIEKARETSADRAAKLDTSEIQRALGRAKVADPYGLQQHRAERAIDVKATEAGRRPEREFQLERDRAIAEEQRKTKLEEQRAKGEETRETESKRIQNRREALDEIENYQREAERAITTIQKLNIPPAEQERRIREVESRVASKVRALQAAYGLVTQRADLSAERKMDEMNDLGAGPIAR